MVPQHRITLLLANLHGGGAEKVMLKLATGFLGKGIAVDLVLVKGQGELLKEIPPNVTLVDLNSPGVLASLPKLIKYLRQRRPFALLSTLIHINLLAIWAKKLAVVPTKIYLRESTDVLRLLSFASRWKNSLNALLIKQSYIHAEAVIAVSHAAAKSLQNFMALPGDKIAVIYNPVIDHELRKKAAEPIDHPWFQKNQPPVILAVGRLSPEKDYPTLVRAFQLLRRRFPARLLILGDGPERTRLTHLIHNLGLTTYVSLPGFVMNPYPYMSHAAVFVLSSLVEGLPGALIEAMACGCRLVSTDCPSGPSEILKDGQYGKLVPMQNPEEMAAAILESLTLPPPTPDQAWLQQFTVEEGVKNYYNLMFNES